MRLPSVPTPAMVEHLNTTYFHRVWNAPDDHGRANFDLLKAAKRLQIGAVPVNLSVVGLPTTDKVYAVYRASVNVFGRFVNLPHETWVKDTYLSDKYNVSITTYATSGRVIPTGGVWLRYDWLRSSVLIAVDRDLTAGCTGVSYPDLHMTVFKDTSRSTPTLSSTFRVSKDTTGPTSVTGVKQSIAYINSQYPAATMIYINGWLYDYADIPTLAPGDIVQTVSDPDVVGYCDLYIDDNDTGYFSTLYGEYREALHIPKVLNPKNIVITNDTITMGIFDVTSKKGVLGHRLDDHAIESITHNDFSVSRQILQAFQTHLGSLGIFVRLYVRMPTDPTPLGRETNNLLDLYTLSDDEIKKQMAGTSSQQITEWRSENLEKSDYLSLLYDFDGFATDDVLPRYVKAMGYYDVVSVLGQSMCHYVYQGTNVRIEKPARLIGYRCEAIVYANGRKIPDHLVTIVDHNHIYLQLVISRSISIPLGTQMSVYITEGGERVFKTFIPTSANRSFTIDSDDYDMYSVINYGNSPVPGWQGSFSKGFVPVSKGSANYTTTLNADGTVTFRFSSIHYGKTMVFAPICAMVTLGFDLDPILDDKAPIIIPLTSLCPDGTVVPLVAYRAMEIYLNGYRLIEGIDYSCEPVMGLNNDVIQTLLTVSNSHYLDLVNPKNFLEVVVHGDSSVSEDKGYAVSNTIHRDTPPMIWSKSCGRVFVRGRLVKDIQESGDRLITGKPVADGSPYLAEWSMPYSVAKLMTGISPNLDNDLLVRIGRLLGMNNPTYPELVSIFQLYALYSPYISKIVSDVASGVLTIKDDPSDTSFLRQFTDYELLKTRDPVIGVTNTLIDRRFVTLAAHYANLFVSNPQQMLCVQRLIALLLTPSNLSINEVLI